MCTPLPIATSESTMCLVGYKSHGSASREICTVNSAAIRYDIDMQTAIGPPSLTAHYARALQSSCALEPHASDLFECSSIMRSGCVPSKASEVAFPEQHIALFADGYARPPTHRSLQRRRRRTMARSARALVLVLLSSTTFNWYSHRHTPF